MRGLLRAALLAVGLLLVLVQGVPAFNVTQLAVDPPGAITPGTLVIVTTAIYFTPSPGETFDNRHDLQFNTTLEGAKWSWIPFEIPPTPSRRGIINPPPHFVFHYPENENVILKLTLEGRAPAVNSTTTITILRIQEVDENGIPISGSSREYFTSVVNVRDISKEEILEEFRLHVDQNASLGINTTQAEAKYLDAKRKIENARALTLPRYGDVLILLNSAQRDITDGELALDKAWAEKEIASAQVPINYADAIIGWFKGNGSTRDDPQLPAIIAKREVAASYLVTANDEMSKGNYAQARVKAEEAYQKANESYNDAISRKDHMVTSCWGCDSGDMTKSTIPAAVIVVIVLLITGIIWWKKHA